MIVLVSGATSTVSGIHRPDLGRLITPASWVRGPYDRLLEDGKPWGADNGAFTGFDEPAFLSMLERLAPHAAGALFVTAPDIVADAAGTALLFAEWGEQIRVRFPVAFVLQDGLEHAGDVPWSELDAVFVGGSTDYKLGAAARAIVGEARRRGKWAHMGRVNSRRRFHYAASIGCQSFDGSSFSRFPTKKIPRMLRWFDERRAQPSILEGLE